MRHPRFAVVWPRRRLWLGLLVGFALPVVGNFLLCLLLELTLESGYYPLYLLWCLLSGFVCGSLGFAIATE